MDFHNNLIISTPEHRFLKELFFCSDKTTEKDINSIAKKTFEKWIVWNPDQLIQNSVQTLMADLVEMSSPLEAEEELAGAIKGLNILLSSAREKDKPHLKNELSQMEKLRVKIDDLFLIKQAIQNNSDLLAVLKEGTFLSVFTDFRTVYGRKREITPDEIKSFLALWKSVESRPCLIDFIQKANYAREMNLYILTLGKIPLTLEKHVNWVEKAHGAWAKQMGDLFLENKLSKSEYETLRTLIDEIFNQRAIVANTQVHTDSIRMAFNNQDSNKDSLRYRNQMRDAPKIPGLEGYYPRDLGQRIFNNAQWIPSLSSEKPIQPIDRVIGFAIPKLAKKETTSRLDFMQVLGSNHLYLNEKERAILGDLLFQTDKILINNPGQMHKWQSSDKKEQDIPPDLVLLMEKFNHPDCPDLNALTFEQKRGLIDESFRFAHEVNYHLADDLLNLF